MTGRHRPAIGGAPARPGSRVCSLDDIRRRRGSVAIEYSLVLPFFLMLLLGITDIGLLSWTTVTLDYATAAAARCAAINTTVCGTTAEVQAYAAANAYGLSVPTGDFTWTTPGCGSQVSASFPFTFVTPWITPKNLNLTASACYPTQP